MLALIKSILSPLFSLIIIIIGNTYFMSFLAVKMDINENSRILGALSFSYYLGFALGAFLIEKVIRRIGHIRSFTTFAAIFSSLTIIMGLIPSIPLWLVIRIFHGLCIAGIFVVVESWFLVIAGPKERGRALALYMVGLYGAQVLSQQILTYFDYSSFTPFAITAFLSSLSAIPVSLKKIDCPDVSSASFLSIKKIIGASVLGFVTCFFAGIALSLVYTLMPYYLLQINFTVAQTGMLMGFVYFGALSLQWPIGWLSDFFDRKKILIFIIFACLLNSAIAGLAVGHLSFYHFLPVAYLFGGLIFSLFPLGMTQICDYLDHSEIVGAMSILLLVYSIGSLIGPITAPIIMEIFPQSGFFIYLTVVLAALCVYSVHRMFQKESLPLSEQKEHIILPRTSIHVGELSEAVPEEDRS
jgi:MFS family permease